ncbi:MAG TPA: RHS repeat-associated core domain-containing protein [Candidatus Acidoferrum sp.]
MQLSFTGNNSTNNNRMDGYCYDSAGNLLDDGPCPTPPNPHLYSYDAENRLIQVGGSAGYCTAGTGTAATACYVYDANGNRVHRTGVVTDTCDASGKRDYSFDLQGRWVGEFNSNGTGCETNVYARGRALVTYLDGHIYFQHADWLGTVRLRNTPTYPTYNFEKCTSLPFGDDLACPGQSTLHFTGKERDAESGLDNFGARYNSSNLGRFMSPDPAGLLAQKPAYPQSWNLYAYAYNNPLILVDPGLDCVYANNAANGVESIDHDSDSEECGGAVGTWVPGYVDENWAHFNNNTGMFQVGSVDGAGANATVDYANFAAGTQTDANGNCTSGCGGYGFAYALRAHPAIVLRKG